MTALVSALAGAFCIVRDEMSLRPLSSSEDRLHSRKAFFLFHFLVWESGLGSDA